MAVIRTKNRFGRRYLTVKEFQDYVFDLDLMAHAPSEGLLEFMEREGLVSPVLRLKFPAPVLRRFEREDSGNRKIVGKVEAEGKRLDSAVETFRATDTTRWQSPYVYGESIHPLDVLCEKPSPFVKRSLEPDTFVAWQKHRASLGKRKGFPVFTNARYTPTYYHYWQVFWVAAALRANTTLLMPVDDDSVVSAIHRGEFHKKSVLSRTYRTINIEARHHLNELREYRAHFAAIGRFVAYRHHALQVHVHDRDHRSGRLSIDATRTYRRRQKELAREVLTRYQLKPRDLMRFIRNQAHWWSDAESHGPAKLADEYKENLAATINCYRLVTKRPVQSVIDQVGRQGHFQPILDVIFPDWREDQRALTIRSLHNWANKHLSVLPVPFNVTEPDLGPFCDWLEDAGLYQYYWHFKRLTDVGLKDGDVDRAGTAAEAVGFANLCEMIANRALEDRNEVARGKALAVKLRLLFGPNGPVDLGNLLIANKHLASTNNHSLAQRRAHIRRIKQGGQYAPVLRALLDLSVIRNEGAHLGLLRYDRATIVEMIESMAMASLMIWRAR